MVIDSLNLLNLIWRCLFVAEKKILMKLNEKILISIVRNTILKKNTANTISENVL